MKRKILLAFTLLFVILSASSSFGAFREVQFGRYYQASRELTPVQWLVLDEDDDSLLLLTKDCVDCLPYNERRIVVTWENSTLRKWLNSEFLNAAFNSQERAAIISLSLLTLDEAMKYLPEVSQRQCSPTAYAKTRGAYTNGRGLCAWWLSSPGNDPLQAAYFSSAGDLGNRPHYVDDNVIATRPAVRVKKSFFANTSANTEDNARYLYSIKPSHQKAQEIETNLQPLIEQKSPFNVKELHEYFLSNPDKAIEEFDMKRLAVEGVASRIGPDSVFGQPSIELSDNVGGKCYVLCVFQSPRDYRNVKVGEKISVRGNYLVTREDYGIVLKICEIF